MSELQTSVKPQRMLLICFDNIGDLVFTSGLLQELEHRYPNLRFDVLVKDYTKQIARLLPRVDRVYAVDPFWDKSPGRGRGGWRNFWQIVRQVPGREYVAALIPNHCYRSAFLALVLRVPMRVGFAWKKNRFFLTHALPALRRDRPVVAQIAALGSFFELDPTVETYRLAVPADLPTLEKQLPPKAVLLHAFAGNPRRCAPLSLWVQFAKALQEASYQVIWFGASHELDQVRAVVGDQFDSNCFLDAYGGADFPVAAQLMTQACAFVGHDSGPLHVAGGLEVPVLGLYLPSEPERTGPQGRGPAVVIYEAHRDNLTLETWLRSWHELEGQIVGRL